jgi:hypothetical protein
MARPSKVTGYAVRHLPVCSILLLRFMYLPARTGKPRDAVGKLSAQFQCDRPGNFAVLAAAFPPGTDGICLC